MISSLLWEVEALGCTVMSEEDKLKLDNASVLTSVHKERLREHKTKILKFFEQQEQARTLGWLVYPFGEAFERRLGRNSYVYLFQEKNGRYTVWRGTWRDKQSADKEKVVIENVDFEKAFEKANSYVNWFSKGR
jgi:hypothetical protein